MAHANKTYTTSGGTVGVNSLFPSGGAPVVVSGIQVVGTVAHGNIITVVSGNDIDFGSIAPEVMFYMKMDAMTAGTNLVLTRGTTFESGYISKAQYLSYTSANQMPIHSVAAMPWGVAFPYGDLAPFSGGAIQNPKMEAKAVRPYSSIYWFAYTQWPAANQANQLATHVGGEQVKVFANQFEDGYTSGGVKIDAYNGIFGTNGTTMLNSMPPLLVTNTGGFGGAPLSDLGATCTSVWYYPSTITNATAVVDTGLVYPKNTNGNVYLDSTHVRSSVLAWESFMVSGATTVLAHLKLIDTQLGVITNVTDTNISDPACLYKKFDRFDTPKNVQGCNVPDNKHFYVNGAIQLVSDVEGVASCRCMISNTPTPSKDATQLSMCIPIMWSAHLLRILVIGGMFEDSSLSGKYLHFFGAFNVFLGSYLIP